MFSWRKVCDTQKLTGLALFCVTKVHCAALELLEVAAGISPPAGQCMHHLQRILVRSFYLFT